MQNVQVVMKNRQIPLLLGRKFKKTLVNTEKRWYTNPKKCVAKQSFRNLNDERIQKMNKTQLIDVVAAKTDLKKKDADAAVAAVFEAIEEALIAGEKIQIIGFGSFDVKERAARTGRNPATGAEIKIPASKYPSFSAGKALKEKVNG